MSLPWKHNQLFFLGKKKELNCLINLENPLCVWWWACMGPLFEFSKGAFLYVSVFRQEKPWVFGCKRNVLSDTFIQAAGLDLPHRSFKSEGREGELLVGSACMNRATRHSWQRIQLLFSYRTHCSESRGFLVFDKTADVMRSNAAVSVNILPAACDSNGPAVFANMLNIAASSSSSHNVKVITSGMTFSREWNGANRRWMNQSTIRGFKVTWCSRFLLLWQSFCWVSFLFFLHGCEPLAAGFARLSGYILNIFLIHVSLTLPVKPGRKCVCVCVRLLVFTY